MKHYYTEPDNIKGVHWAASTDCFGSVLVQLGDSQQEQVRIELTPVQARIFADKLYAEADRAEAQFGMLDAGE